MAAGSGRAGRRIWGCLRAESRLGCTPSAASDAMHSVWCKAAARRAWQHTECVVGRTPDAGRLPGPDGPGRLRCLGGSAAGSGLGGCRFQADTQPHPACKHSPGRRAEAAAESRHIGQGDRRHRDRMDRGPGPAAGRARAGQGDRLPDQGRPAAGSTPDASGLKGCRPPRSAGPLPAAAVVCRAPEGPGRGRGSGCGRTRMRPAAGLSRAGDWVRLGTAAGSRQAGAGS